GWGFALDPAPGPAAGARDPNSRDQTSSNATVQHPTWTRKEQTAMSVAVLGKIEECDVQPKSSLIGVPSASLYGRPMLSIISVAGSRPKRQNNVAARSAGPTGSVTGCAPILSLAP